MMRWWWAWTLVTCWAGALACDVPVESEQNTELEGLAEGGATANSDENHDGGWGGVSLSTPAPLAAQGCTPGQPLCDADQLFACSDDGQMWLLVQDCQVGSCDSASGACTPVAGETLEGEGLSPQNEVEGCSPTCLGAECGEDGCGGVCGVCPQGWGCSAGACVEVSGGEGSGCVPACAGLECGSDGCGGICGTCAAGAQCVQGDCQGDGGSGCAPDCAGKQCGSDGCGSVCGSCAEGQTCSATGVCVMDAPAQPISCPPNGTGAGIGDQIKNMKWTDSTGALLESQGFCGVSKAIVLIESAGW